MTHDAMTEHYEEITVCGKPALFTSIRIKRDTVPEGLYAYDVRHDDECRGIPCEIAPFIMVNHWGTIILTEPLELPDDGRRYLDEETDWNKGDGIYRPAKSQIQRWARSDTWLAWSVLKMPCDNCVSILGQHGRFARSNRPIKDDVRHL